MNDAYQLGVKLAYIGAGLLKAPERGKDFYRAWLQLPEQMRQQLLGQLTPAGKEVFRGKIMTEIPHLDRFLARSEAKPRQLGDVFELGLLPRPKP
jgi:hypothetical protein